MDAMVTRRVSIVVVLFDSVLAVLAGCSWAAWAARTASYSAAAVASS